MNEFYVYLYFRLDGTPCYVGKGKGDRYRAKTSRNPHLKSILKANNYRIPVVIIRSELTEQQALDLEAALIAALGRECDGGPLVNLTLGGVATSGFVFSDESKHKMSESAKRRITPEFREAARRRGQETASEEMARRARLTPSQRGWKRSELARQNMRLAALGKVFSPEHIENLRKAQLGRKHTAETIEKIRQAALRRAAD